MAISIYRIPQGDGLVISKKALRDQGGRRPASLDAWGFALEVRASLADEAAIISLTKAEMDVEGLNVYAPLTLELLAELELGKVYYYSFKAKPEDGDPFTIEEGVICVEVSPMPVFPQPGNTVITTEDGSEITTEDGTVIVAG